MMGSDREIDAYREQQDRMADLVLGGAAIAVIVAGMAALAWLCHILVST